MDFDHKHKHPKSRTQLQIRDKDMLMLIVLALHIFYIFSVASHDTVIPYLSIGLLLTGIVLPILIRPLTLLWFALSEFIGKYISNGVLMIIFYGLVVPVGIAQRYFSLGHLPATMASDNKVSNFNTDLSKMDEQFFDTQF